MRILFITDNFPPETNAPAVRTFEHSKIWINEGAQVTVITCFPNFPKGEIFPGYTNKLYQVENMNGIKVIRVWSFISANSGFIKRSLDFISFCVSSFIAGLFIKSDIIIATSPQFFTTWSAFLLSKIKRIPWIFELRDLWPETIKAVGSLKEGFIYNFLEKIEIGLYKDAQIIISVTNSFKENLIKRGIRPNKIEVITNGIDRSYFDNNLDKSVQKNKNTTIGYIGTHGVCQKLQFILEVIKNNDLQDYQFKFVGEGADKKQLVDFKEKYRLNNVSFHNSVKKSDVLNVLQSCDAVLVPLRNSKTFDSVIPSKIFESAYLKVPIILGVRGESKVIIENYQLGVCYEPENEESFIKALRNLKKFKFDDALHQKFIEIYSRENLAKRMLKHVISLRS